MPIVKETSARLVKQQIPYEIVSRDVVQEITYPPALAIYIYLLTLPEGWVVRKKQVVDHFDGLGEKKWRRAMRELKQLGVVWIAETRNELGHIADRSIMVETIPSSPNVPYPQLGLPTVGKRDALRDTDITRDTDTVLVTEEITGIKGWDEWVEYRKQLKKSMTKATIRKQVAMLEKHTADEQQDIINQSIINGWTGLFELKGNGNGNTQGRTRANQDSRRLSAGERVRAATERRRAEQAREAGGDVGSNR